jgi:hypothetical protein
MLHVSPAAALADVSSWYEKYSADVERPWLVNNERTRHKAGDERKVLTEN